VVVLNADPPALVIQAGRIVYDARPPRQDTDGRD
jgi:hypothetical protein